MKVVLRSDPDLLIRTLLDWTYQDAGIQVLSWDGRDSSGYLVDKGRYPCMILIEADKEIHRTHEHSRCKELKIQLDVPKKVLLRENVAVQISFTLVRSRSGYTGQNGCTARLYLDYERIVERVLPPTGRANYSLDLPVPSEESGPHLLTLVVSDGADHMGAVSRAVHFKIRGSGTTN